MSRVKIIEHNGRDIIFSDFTHVKDQQEIIDALDEVQRYPSSQRDIV